MTRNSDVALDANARTGKVQSLYGKGNDVVVVSNHINAGGQDAYYVINSRHSV